MSKEVLILTVTVITIIITIFLSTTAISLFDGILSLPSPVANVWALNVTGTEGDDTLTGTAEKDYIYGYAGNDMISGLEGNDQIRGGAGDDTIHGDKGNDRIRAGSGNDMIFGDDGNDVLIAGRGDDTLTGGSGKDTFNCGKGNDTVTDASTVDNDNVTATCAKISPEPIINDPNLLAQVVFKGLKFPTSMAFLGPNDILVLEKNGTVQRVVDGKMLAAPILHVNVSFADERGLLGIATSAKNLTGTGPSALSNYVFVYFTEAGSTKGDVPAGNRVYRYELVNNDKLVKPKLLLDVPAIPGPSHNGGKLIIGPDNNLYFSIGDLKSSMQFPSKDFQTKAQNYLNGIAPDGRAGILRITQDGGVVGGVGILGNEDPLNKYYAYGIKNSFGIGFDPVTGKLWDTENGPAFGDEINLVEPGFNSGWAKIQGIWTVDQAGNKGAEVAAPNSSLLNSGDGLEDFGGKGKYSSPELTWADSFGPTALKFLNSDKLGKQYENDIFVGDINYGNLYHFKLDQNRTGLVLDGPLADKVADKGEDQPVVFAHGFGGITDIEVGPDGYLYVLTFDKVDGTIFRIVPNQQQQ